MKEILEKLIKSLEQNKNKEYFNDLYFDGISLKLNSFTRLLFDENTGYLAKKTTFHSTGMTGELRGVNSNKVYFKDFKTPNCTEQELTELLNEIEK